MHSDTCISDTLRAYANSRKDDRDSHLPLVEFAIDNTASMLGDDLTPAHTPISPLAASESPRPRRRRVANGLRALRQRMRELLAVAQTDRKAKPNRVDMVFQVGDRVLPRTKELLDSANIGKLRPRWDSHFQVHVPRLPEPQVLQRLHPRAAASHTLQPYRQRRSPQTLL